MFSKFNEAFIAEFNMWHKKNTKTINEDGVLFASPPAGLNLKDQ